MALPAPWLDELMAKNDIVSVISSYTELKPKGRKLWGLCPLHGEKTASFSVSPDKQLFYCFGCHAGGTVVQFVMDIERLPYYEAIQHLAARVGMEMPREVNDEAIRRQRAHRERLYAATQQAARFFCEQFLGEAGKAARDYATRRGLSKEIVLRYGIGFAPDSWDALFTHLTQAGFDRKEQIDAGLLVYNAEKDRAYDAFRNRLIFPILGTNGRVLGFGGRVMGDENPKYINTGDTPIYNKRNNLYGLYLQKNAKLDDLVMVEGYMDVIGLYQAGVTNAVASLGTALTQQQARLLKRYTETVTIAYDGDAAGQNATLRGLDILAEEGLAVR
ncbi:MAG: DNA primase, partial [Clostridiales bacterium]|nr:DNA primase [Clostridiales bacterium]